MNDYDIPELDPSGCADGVMPPVIKWGTRARSSPMPGTYHFYTHDYKFEGLLRNPDVLLESGCRAIIEPNFSTFWGMPAVEVLLSVYRKRKLARHWQDRGIGVVVDLNVDPRLRHLAMIGVPRGWSSFATRVHREHSPADVEEVFRFAREYAGRDDPSFAVYGGGRRYKSLCRTRGWAWIPEHWHVITGLESAYDLDGAILR